MGAGSGQKLDSMQYAAASNLPAGQPPSSAPDARLLAASREIRLAVAEGCFRACDVAIVLLAGVLSGVAMPLDETGRLVGQMLALTTVALLTASVFNERGVYGADYGYLRRVEARRLALAWL
ncbi:MAG TPA: hypothetical protein VGC80_13720, partial [Acetobacteraceae bacterium]